MTDRELLELAAKAAGYICVQHTGYDEEYDIYVTHFWRREGDDPQGNLIKWNPTTNDGDALRLAVKLKLDINHGGDMVVAEQERPAAIGVCEGYATDPYAATRRAIVRAAAEIGRSMK